MEISSWKSDDETEFALIWKENKNEKQQQQRHMIEAKLWKRIRWVQAKWMWTW